MGLNGQNDHAAAPARFQRIVLRLSLVQGIDGGCAAPQTARPGARRKVRAVHHPAAGGRAGVAHSRGSQYNTPDQKTVSVAVLLTAPDEAVMVQLPALTPVAMPRALMVAMAGSLEVQLTAPEMLPLELSEKVPVAVNVVVVPFATDMVRGATVMPVNVASVTVMELAAEVAPPDTEAVIVVVPAALPVTTPALLTLAVAEAADNQVTE